MQDEEQVGSTPHNEPQQEQPQPRQNENQSGQRLTGSVPGPTEFKEGFEGEAPINFQPLFPGQTPPTPPATQPAEAAPASQPPAETQQD